MDAELDSTMNEILKRENVTGAMFVDKNGLAISGMNNFELFFFFKQLLTCDQ